MPSRWAGSAGGVAAPRASGLGLSVVQGIVADHYGAIEGVRSDDSGTEFRLLLPVS